MRSFCLFLCVPSSCLRAGIVEPEEMAADMQRLSKHFPTAANIHATTEKLLGALFSMWSVSHKILCRKS
jgi:hypothetical protein